MPGARISLSGSRDVHKLRTCDAPAYWQVHAAPADSTQLGGYDETKHGALHGPPLFNIANIPEIAGETWIPD